MKINFYARAVKTLRLLSKIALRTIILFCAASYMAIGMMVLVGGDFVTAIFTILLSLCFLAGDSIVSYLERREKL